MVTWIRTLGLLFLGALLGVALRIVLTEPLQYFFARLLGPLIPTTRRGVKGIWKSVYQFPSGGNQKTGVQLMKLRQVGPWVVGSCLAGDPHEHRVRGRLKEHIYFTGVWENAQKHREWHGAFQVVLHPAGGTMEGEWVGFDSANRVAYGPWRWIRLSTSLKRDNIEHFLDDWRRGGRSFPDEPQPS